MSKTTNIHKVIKEAESWMGLPGVEGVAEGKKNNKPCIVVLISTESAELKNKIPATFKGYPVTFQESGIIGIQ